MLGSNSIRFYFVFCLKIAEEIQYLKTYLENDGGAFGAPEVTDTHFSLQMRVTRRE